MKIISWNVNGLRAAMNKGFIDFIRNSEFDIVGIQETKLQKEQIPEEINDLDEFYQYWDFAEKKGYSGVALFSRKKPLRIQTVLGKPELDNEGRIVIAEYDDYYLINCYFPNGQMSKERLDFKLKFYDEMFNRMQQLRESGKGVIVMGDYNTAHKEIDLKNPKENENTSGFLPIERAWLDKLIERGWIDTFREFNQNGGEYTWWTYRFNARLKNIGWRIDYFFVNKEIKDRLKSAFIMKDVEGSDHCPLGIEIEI